MYSLVFINRKETIELLNEAKEKMEKIFIKVLDINTFADC